jgi:hypothetical protein
MARLEELAAEDRHPVHRCGIRNLHEKPHRMGMAIEFSLTVRGDERRGGDADASLCRKREPERLAASNSVILKPEHERECGRVEERRHRASPFPLTVQVVIEVFISPPTRENDPNTRTAGWKALIPLGQPLIVLTRTDAQTDVGKLLYRKGFP